MSRARAERFLFIGIGQETPQSSKTFDSKICDKRYEVDSWWQTKQNQYLPIYLLPSFHPEISRRYQAAVIGIQGKCERLTTDSLAELKRRPINLFTNH